jgi:ubiquitin carboxyl-terminal hydrolase 8
MFTEILQKHSSYTTIRDDPTYRNLRKVSAEFKVNVTMSALLDRKTSPLNVCFCRYEQKVVEDALTRLEGIESVMKDESQDNDSKPKSQRSVSSVNRSRNNSLSYLDNLPPVPTHAPIIHKSPLQAPKHPPPPVPASKPTWTPPRVQPSVPAIPDERSLTVGNTVVPPLQPQAAASFPIPLPSLTKNTFPQTPTINPDELAKLLSKRDDPPSILLLDIRPRDMYKRGCICHKWVVQLEPMVLKRE